MLTALYTIIVFSLIIAVHEFGHFIVSKVVGITVHEFSIGMGPKIFSKIMGDTDYALRLLPIGGYVRLEGEDNESEDKNAFCNKKPWQRFLVLFAGAFMNFVLGFLIFLIIIATSKGIVTNYVGEVIDGSSFSQMDVMPDDKIIKMKSDHSSVKVSSYNDINYFLNMNYGKSITFTFKRNDKVIEKEIVPTEVNGYKGYMFGFKPRVDNPNFFNVFKASYNQCKFVVKLVFGSFVQIFTGGVSITDFSGPVGIINEIGNAAEEGNKDGFLQGFINVLSIAGLISINLGVVNLLPLPALDGGRILLVIFEAIRRKPLNREKEGMFHFIGFAILILFMLLITFFDIRKLML